MVERPVRTVLAVIAALLVASVGACEYLYPTYTFRYRLTIEVEMPDGTARAESSVVEISSWRLPPWSLPPGTVRLTTTGEATPVGLDDGRLLVALLTGRFPFRTSWGEKEPTSSEPVSRDAPLSEYRDAANGDHGCASAAPASILHRSGGRLRVQVASDALRAGYSACGGRAGLAEAHLDGRPVLRGVMFSQLAAERLR